MDNKDYISITDVANMWDISERRVRVLCQNGQIDGAVKIGKQWCIPKLAQKPSDKRTQKQMDKLTVVVAGVTNDIGQSLVNLLIAENYKVIGLYSALEKAPDIQNESVCFIPVDFADRNSLLRVCKSINNPLAGLVVCELYFNLENLEDFDYDDFEKSFKINVYAPNILVRELVKLMDHTSSIVLVSSVEAKRGSFGASAYAAAQAAKRNLVSSICNVYSEMYGVRINTVMTGWIGNMGFDSAFNKTLESIPMKRLGFPDEVADDIYLMLTKHKYTTGSSLVSDGGYLQVDEQSKTEFLQTGIFYKWIEKFFTAETTKKIRSISMVMPNEWNDDYQERRFREYNIEAMQKGLDFKRFFVLDYKTLPRLKKEKILVDFIRKTSKISYAVDISKISPKVLSIIKSGFLLFDDEISVVDYETNDLGRGYLTFNKKQIADYKYALNELEKIAVPIKYVFNTK